ncbi:hypothetical protein OWV82_018112 [Melia azedarach]|uniref:Uncharacterized protein n=1 Tax=Melia azedarach TaxID=155640 RepID=A0ACC1XA38_MELAZ|nr:hypothetical protein OWV82_018112 [Melia azedarach]
MLLCYNVSALISSSPWLSHFLPSEDLQPAFSVHELLAENEYGIGEAKCRRPQTQIAGCQIRIKAKALQIPSQRFRSSC